MTALISWPQCRIAFPGSWNTLPPSSSSSLPRGLVSFLRTPMHRSITLNQPDNSIQRGNWHHLLHVGLVGDWQMIGLVNSVVRAVYHPLCVLLMSLSVFNDNLWWSYHSPQNGWVWVYVSKYIICSHTCQSYFFFRKSTSLRNDRNLSDVQHSITGRTGVCSACVHVESGPSSSIME